MRKRTRDPPCRITWGGNVGGNCQTGRKSGRHRGRRKRNSLGAKKAGTPSTTKIFKKRGSRGEETLGVAEH